LIARLSKNREKCNAYEICIEKVKQKKPLERTMLRQEDNIKMNLKWGANTLNGWFPMASYTVISSRNPQRSGNFLIGLIIIKLNKHLDYAVSLAGIFKEAISVSYVKYGRLRR
jgi:hypothetical protein